MALAKTHFEEVQGGVDPRRPFNLDLSLMELLCSSGSMKIITTRFAKELVGYCTWQISPDVESAGLLIAQQGAWFVDSGLGNQGIGHELFSHSLRVLRELGVSAVFPHHRLEGRGARLGSFFKSQGAVELQHTYFLWIGDKPNA
jgi:hypothetical protein